MEKLNRLLLKRKELEYELEEINFRIKNDGNNMMKYIKTKRLHDLELKKNKKEIEVEEIKKQIEIFKNNH